MLKVFYTDDTDSFKSKALVWADSFNTACYFDSNNFSDPYSAFGVYIGAGKAAELIDSEKSSFAALEQFLNSNKAYIPGYFSYDLKNEIEHLNSENADKLEFAEIHFFLPKHSILIKNNEISIFSDDADEVWKLINQTNLNQSKEQVSIPEILGRFSRNEYIQTIREIQKHIQRGDIYEMNFCQEFYSEKAEIKPLELFTELNNLSPTPFANYFKIDDHYIISATPERFLSRRGNKLISQPIKGTSSRNTDLISDNFQKEELLLNEKERAENVMIVDLVRNDLTKSAKPGTVKVEELFGIYSFKQVHQMISTVVCQVDENLSNPRIIANTFPMGSMTGAPKIKAMQLAEKYERSKRGVYSGAIGYFGPDGDFDFNVVIRTILYNRKQKYLSFHVGSAITLDSDPEKEYEECLLKGKAIRAVLNQTLP
jgi:para-aminobenzoate synthetase component 1